MITIDFDDFSDDNTGLKHLEKLRAINPNFKATLFAVPLETSKELVADLPEWLELAAHGQGHKSNYECLAWNAEQTWMVLQQVERLFDGRFAHGFKAPGWMYSQGCLDGLARSGWWVAVNEQESHSHPPVIMPSMNYYVVGEDSWHGHIQDVCGNGLEERFDELADRIKDEHEFRYASESLYRHPGAEQA